MKRFRIPFLLIIVILLSITVAPALAGGWATVTVHEMPEEIVAGEETRIVFKVWQHGKTPVHFLQSGSRSVAVTPVLEAQHPESAETIEWEAVPEKELGVFSVSGVFPHSGAWEWSINPLPLGGASAFTPLNVAEPVPQNAAITAPATAAIAAGAWQMWFIVALAAAALTALVLFVTGRRRREAQLANQT